MITFNKLGQVKKRATVKRVKYNNAAVRPGSRIRIHFIRIRIQHFRLNTDPESDPTQIQGFHDQKLKKIYSWKKKFNVFLDQKLQFTYP